MIEENFKSGKRVQVSVVSDTHLGAYGSKAKDLLAYLKSIDPDQLVLNGDIIDVWQFKKSYFPKSHLKVIRQIVKMMERGTKVHYLVGNHDEVFRRFVGLSLGNLSIDNKLVLELDNKKTWMFHGDVFDVVMHRSKWLAILGAHGYAILTLINRSINWLLSLFGKHRISLSRDIKSAVKNKRKNITTFFEQTVADLAIKKGYDYAICGHIHWPDKKRILNDDGEVVYLNSGDWVENLTAIEYYDNDWHLYQHQPGQNPEKLEDELDALVSDDFLLSNHKVLFKTMFNDVVKS